MFSDYGRDLLRSGIIDAKAGNKASARRYLDRAIYISNDHDVLAEAWFWMSQVTEDGGEKRKALENCLAHDLYHARARRALAILDGKLKADEIVDPDHLPPAPEGLHAVDAQRFMCPKCGGHEFSKLGDGAMSELYELVPAGKEGALPGVDALKYQKPAELSAAAGTVSGMIGGQDVSLHQAMIAMEEASVSFQLMVEVRNKLLESYQELMRMQI